MDADRSCGRCGRETIPFSHYEVVPAKRRLIVDCTDSPDAAADLRNPECRRSVLLGLAQEFGVETVVLSHDREKQYGRVAVGILSGILDLGRLMDRFSARAPAPDFPRLGRREIAAKCAACRFNPQALFPRLREAVLDDLGGFHAAFLETVQRLQAYREPGCRACTKATRDDLIFLFHETTRFGESALHAAAEGE